jgi:hypothetical protein
LYFISKTTKSSGSFNIKICFKSASQSYLFKLYLQYKSLFYNFENFKVETYFKNTFFDKNKYFFTKLKIFYENRIFFQKIKYFLR